MQVRRRRTTGGLPTIPVAVITGAALLGIVAAWWLLRDSGEVPAPTTPIVATPVDSATADSIASPPVDLPALSESDGFVREALGILSRHPGLASWLATDDLVHRFVGAVVDVAGGESPTENLDFLQPAGEFRVRESGSATLIDESSYRRYDGFVATLESIRTDDLVTLYRELNPLFEEAFQELGIRNWTFDDTLDRALTHVLDVSPPTGPMRVEMDRTNYVFVDPALESRSPVAKQLLRMGPDNLARFQTKVRAVRDGLR